MSGKSSQPRPVASPASVDYVSFVRCFGCEAGPLVIDLSDVLSIVLVGCLNAHAEYFRPFVHRKSEIVARILEHKLGKDNLLGVRGPDVNQTCVMQRVQL